MPMASQSAFSSTSRLITSGADSAIARAALAMCVGVQMLGGASTRYLHSRDHPCCPQDAQAVCHSCMQSCPTAGTLHTQRELSKAVSAPLRQEIVPRLWHLIMTRE